MLTIKHPSASSLFPIAYTAASSVLIVHVSLKLCRRSGGVGSKVFHTTTRPRQSCILYFFFHVVRLHHATKILQKTRYFSKKYKSMISFPGYTNLYIEYRPHDLGFDFRFREKIGGTQVYVLE